MVRHCCNPVCRRGITECNGSTIGRDYLAFLEEKIPWAKVRELCGKCIAIYEPGGEAFEALLERAPASE